MTYPHGGASQIWRDGDGTAHNPAKSQIRDWGASVEQKADANEVGLAQLQALNASGAPMYVDTTAGLAATSDGDYFNVPSSDPLKSVLLYQNSTGSAVLVKEYPNTEAVNRAMVSRWVVGAPLTFSVSKAGQDFTVSWATLRLLDGALAVRKVRDQAQVTVANGDCLYFDTAEAYVDPGYTVQSGLLNAFYDDFVTGTKVLLLGNYYGIAMGVLAEKVETKLARDVADQALADAAAAQADADAAQVDADAGIANSKKARRWTSGNAVTTQQSGNGIKVRTTRGYHYQENNGGAFAHKFAAVAETSLAAGYGLVVDLDGTPDGNGELVPQYVAIASGAQTGWEAGERLVLIARDSDGQLFGEYTINAHVGAFDGDVCFLLNSGDQLPDWNDSTRTLTWPDLILMRHRGNGGGAARIKLQAGSIVVPVGGFQTVVLDLSLVDDTLTPNTAVSVGQYTDPTPGWDGATGNWLPLFAVGFGFAYPVRFPPTQGATNFPAIIADQSPYELDEVVVKANGTDTVDIFMKGSEPTSNKYLQYPMVNIVNAGIGADVWRWQRVYEAERTGDAAFTQGLEICNSGENEMAIMINGKTDHIGGNAHGDEQQVWSRMLIDGSEVSLAAAADYRARRVEFMQESDLFEPDTATPQDTRVAKAYRRWKFEAGYVDIWNHIVWEAVHTLDQSFLAMLTFLRMSGATQVSDKGFREPLWAEEDISVSGFTHVFDTAGIAKASGPNGYSAEVEILDGWDKSGRRFNFSNSASYNKFYFDFTGGGYVTSIGEVFKSHARYKLDTKN